MPCYNVVMETTVTKDWLSIDEAAEVIGVHPRTVRRYIRDNRLPVSRVSTQVVRIRRSDIDKFLESGLPVQESPSERPKPVPAQPARFTAGRPGRFG